MNTLLWIFQVFAAIIFIYSGINKSFYSEQRLVAKGQTGVEGLPIYLTRFIGIIEILGGIGLILPHVVNILNILTPISAVGFCIIMILAARIHYRRKETNGVLINSTLFIMCLTVAIFRF